jgi:pSer/pThr/pTyr-binding forkhead associated (FHA) protein
MRGNMSKLSSWLSPDTTASSPKLEIASGLHKGTSVDLTGTSYSIGSSPDCDIVLRDEGVAAEHAQIRIDGGSVSVETQSHPVGIGNGKVLNHQEGCRLRLPATLTFGSTEVIISQEGAVEPSVGQMASRLAVPVAAAILIPVILIVAIASSPDMSATKAPARTAATNSAADTERPTAMGDASTQKPAGEAADELQKRITAAGLEGVTLAANGDDIVASGAIPAADHAKWVDAMKWFDRTYAGKASLVSMVSADRKAGRPPVAIQAVWYGDNPYMIASDGKRYYQGASLNGGWMVRAIQKDKVVLAKGADEFQLTY